MCCASLFSLFYFRQNLRCDCKLAGMVVLVIILSITLSFKMLPLVMKILKIQLTH